MILNNKILRLLQKAPIDTRITQLYTNFNTMPLPDLHKFQISKFVHKFIHRQDQLPSIYSYYFNKNRIFHSYNTVLKTLSIPSLLELLLGKDLSHIKVLSFGTLKN